MKSNNSPGRILCGIFICGLALHFSTAYSQTAEPAAAKLAQWLIKFPEADADGDGKLTAEEAAAYRKVAKGMPKKSGSSGFRGERIPNFHAGWEEAEFPEHAVSNRAPGEIMAIYKKGSTVKAGIKGLSFPEPSDGGMRIVGIGHSFMAPGYKTLPHITEAAGFNQPLCLHTGGGITGSASYKWEQENGIFQFDHEPTPKLLAAISNADWEAMLFGEYHGDRPKFYTCWIDFCSRYNPGMKFYLLDAWPQLFQIEKLFGETENPKTEAFFSHEVLDQMSKDKRVGTSTIAESVRKESTEDFFVIPVNDAITQAAKLHIDKKLPGVDSLFSIIGGGSRSVWRDQTGHLGPGFDRLEGYVFYATLYGKSPELIQGPIAFSDQDDFPGSALDKIFCQIAWQAVINHPLSGVTDLNQNGVADRLE